jgi:flagellin
MVLRAKNTDPLNIQAGAESGPENQMSLNVVESTSIQSLGVDNAYISTTQGTLQLLDDFELASQTLNAARGQVGAVGQRLVSTSNSLNIGIENLTLSKSG